MIQKTLIATKTSRALLAGILLLASTPCWSGDWTIPLTVQSGSASTSLTLGIQESAGNGYDVGKDTPTRAYEDEALYASFPHADWGITVGGESTANFLRDIRGTLPQEFTFEVRSLQSSVTLSWTLATLPAKTTLTLNHLSGGAIVDMARQSSYSFNPGGAGSVPFTITVAQGDVTPPPTPTGLTATISGNSVYLAWNAVTDPDLGGYRLYYGKDSASLRSLDLKLAQNFNLANILGEDPWYACLTAYDKNGNESLRSDILTLSRAVTPPPIDPIDPTDPTDHPVTPPPTTVNYGDIDNDGRISASDALSALNMAIGKKAVNLKADVAPLINGVPTPDGKITTADALVILRKAVGLW